MSDNKTDTGRIDRQSLHLTNLLLLEIDALKHQLSRKHISEAHVMNSNAHFDVAQEQLPIQRFMSFMHYPTWWRKNMHSIECIKNCRRISASLHYYCTHLRSFHSQPNRRLDVPFFCLHRMHRT